MILVQFFGTATLLIIASIVSMASFPPSHVSLQIIIAGLWLWTGFVIGKLWS